MTESKEKSNFWTTLPGILTAIASLVVAIGGIYEIQARVRDDSPRPPHTENPTPSPTPPDSTSPPSSATTSPSSAPDWLRDGEEIELRIQSSPPPTTRWLDGRTADGTVGLANSTGDDFTGTKWKVHVVGNEDDRIIHLETLGNFDGLRWLDVKTDGTVGLADSTGDVSTQWKVHILGNEDDRTIHLEALGATNNLRWLDGRTADGTVGLADSTGGNFTGTRWRVSLP
ncbi:hypothetical protein H6F88_26780 [Oculatella sp. FACHB-28]|uniref:hypothetical protein n=1 Tax=Oculatella sp. FACHB-28 TaxID=2692845 RepID=UPI001685ECF5|nr:hypothetical protein [Oculatella sp. FACHB-28]MBD2059558.1 hypothetical protein [Oculatella sp. FACHB-28]